MAKVTFDLKDVDHDEATKERVYEVPPTGVYPARIAAFDAEAPEGKNPRLHVVLEITKPANNKYHQLHDYITYLDTQKLKMDQFLAALGVTTKSKRSGSFDTEKYKGKIVQIKVGHETSTWNGETRTRGRVNFYFSGKNGKASAAEETDEEITLVMHGAAADQGDGESEAYLREQAEQYEIDPDEIDTWAEVATLIEEAQQGDEPEEEEEEDEPEEEETSEDIEGPDADLVEAADEGDTDSATALYEWAKENDGGEPDEFDTWAEWAASLAGDEEEDETPDYASMKLSALKALAKERGIPTGGKPEELRERLEEFDNTDPFNE